MDKRDFNLSCIINTNEINGFIIHNRKKRIANR